MVLHLLRGRSSAANLRPPPFEPSGRLGLRASSAAPKLAAWPSMRLQSGRPASQLNN